MFTGSMLREELDKIFGEDDATREQQQAQSAGPSKKALPQSGSKA